MEIFFDLFDFCNYCKEFLISGNKSYCNFGYVGGFYKIKIYLKCLKRVKLYIKDIEIFVIFFKVLKEIKNSKFFVLLVVKEK